MHRVKLSLAMHLPMVVHSLGVLEGILDDSGLGSVLFLLVLMLHGGDCGNTVVFCRRTIHPRSNTTRPYLHLPAAH